MNSSTLQYYNTFAQEYSDSTLQVQITPSLTPFCESLPPKSSILDVGCGSGRDSLYFLQQGFNVSAFDGSAKLAKLASKELGQQVKVMNIQDMAYTDQFDGVWAMASLLHLKKSELPDAIKNCVAALKIENSGKFFASFKIGSGEEYDDKGRFFTYYQPDELKSILQATNYFDNVDFVVNEDTMGRKGLSWVSFIAEKKTGLILETKSKPKLL